MEEAGARVRDAHEEEAAFGAAEEVDGVPVLHAAPVPVPALGGPWTLPAAVASAPAVLTASGFLAGILTVALLRRRRGTRALVGRAGRRRLAGRLGRGGARGRRPDRPARLLRIVDSRSILLDIHLVDRE